MKVTAVYPGSFDPVTLGHLDIIKRAGRIFDELIVTVFANPQKDPLFTMQERVEFLREATRDLENVEVDAFRGLLVRYMKKKSASVIVKGLRAVSDFEYEFQMASMNKKLDCDIETVFMMTNTEYAYLSSSVVKEVARFKGCVDGLVPENVIPALYAKYGRDRV